MSASGLFTFRLIHYYRYTGYFIRLKTKFSSEKKNEFTAVQRTKEHFLYSRRREVLLNKYVYDYYILRSCLRLRRNTWLKESLITPIWKFSWCIDTLYDIVLCRIGLYKKNRVFLKKRQRLFSDSQVHQQNILI